MSATNEQQTTPDSDPVQTNHNPAYGIKLEGRGKRPRIPQPYEEMDCQEEPKVYTSLRVTDHDGTMYQTLVKSNETHGTGPKTHHSHKQPLFITIATIAVFITWIVIAGLVGALIYTNQSYKLELQTLKQRMDTLTSRNLNDSWPTINNSSADMLARFEEQITQLRTDVQTQAANQSDSVETLQSRVHIVSTQIGTTATQLVTNSIQTRTALDSLQSSVDTLTTRVNSSVNLYQNCIQENETCGISPISGTLYRSACITPPLPMNIQGYYTVDMRCDYDTNRSSHDAGTLYKTQDNVRCQCSASLLSRYTGNHLPLTTVLTITCTLVVVRCPIEQSLF